MKDIWWTEVEACRKKEKEVSFLALPWFHTNAKVQPQDLQMALEKGPISCQYSTEKYAFFQQHFAKNFPGKCWDKKFPWNNLYVQTLH